MANKTEYDVWTVKLKPYQADFLRTKARYPAMVASWSTGKTMTGIFGGMELSEESPNNLGMVIRKEFTDLRDSTIKDFESYTGIKVNSNREAIVPAYDSQGRQVGTSTIMFRHGKEIDGNVLKNINLGWFMIEQAEEFDSDDEFTLLRGRLRRKGVKRRKGMVIANQKGHNWIWNLWKINATQDKEFFLSEATSFDNAENIEPDVLEDWEKLRVQNPPMYNRYVANSWDVEDSQFVVLPESLVRSCLNNQLRDDRRFVVMDIAIENDRNVIYGMEGTRVIDKMVWKADGTIRTNEIAGWAKTMLHKIKGELIAGDAIGEGAGVFDVLEGWKTPVMRLYAYDKATDPKKYVNARAEWHDYARHCYERMMVDQANDPEEIHELSMVQYLPNAHGPIKLERKDEVKKRLKKSPDLSDTRVMGIWVLQFIKHKEEKESRTARSRWTRKGPMGGYLGR